MWNRVPALLECALSCHLDVEGFIDRRKKVLIDLQWVSLRRCFLTWKTTRNDLISVSFLAIASNPANHLVGRLSCDWSTMMQQIAVRVLLQLYLPLSLTMVIFLGSYRRHVSRPVFQNVSHFTIEELVFMIDSILTLFFHSVTTTLTLEHLLELGLLMLVGDWVWAATWE